MILLLSYLLLVCCNLALYRSTGYSGSGLTSEQTSLAVDGSISKDSSRDTCSIVTGTGVSWWLDFGESQNVSKVSNIFVDVLMN